MKNNKYHKPPITCKIKHNHYKHLPSRVAMSGMSLHCAYGVGKGNETLIILAHQTGWSLKECLQAAWGEIKDRTGEMRNGVFVKSEDL